MTRGAGISLPPCFLRIIVVMGSYSFRGIGENEMRDITARFSDMPFTQTLFYGAIQESVGRSVRYFVIEDGDKVAAFGLAVVYPLAFDKKCIYIPYGPVMIGDYSKGLLICLKNGLIRLGKDTGAVFARLDFYPPSVKGAESFVAGIFSPAPSATVRSSYFQPRSEWMVDISQSEEDILAGMHPKGRYSIRLAERRGVKVEIIADNFMRFFDDFYSLMKETASRDGFHLHPRSYYENIFRDLGKAKRSFLSVAKVGDKIVAIDLVVVSGDTANYVFGATSSRHRELMPAYLSKWKGMVHGKSLGLKRYSFGGVSLEGEIPGWEGITVFKKKFGGYAFRHPRFYDAVISRPWYLLYSSFKFLVRRYSIIGKIIKGD